YVAGIGNDARGFRWFNTLKQSEYYDAQGDYVRHWLPRLKDVPDRFIHQPWKMHAAQQQRSACIIGADYPEPIVDLFASADHFQSIYDNNRPAS
ncbi:MAG: FAD-binding domain-containing protein, partial [Planctomycetota bacterium]